MVRHYSFFSNEGFLPSPLLHYDAASMGSVSNTWQNIGSKTGYDLFQVGAGNIMYESSGGPNGMPCVLFSGGNYFQAQTPIGISLAQPRTIIAVCEVSQGQGVFGWGVGDPNNHGGLLDLYGYANTVILHMYGYQTYFSGYQAPPQFNTIAVRMRAANGSNMSIEAYCNGVGYSDIKAISTVNTPFRLGQDGVFAAVQPRRISKVQIWDSYLSNGQFAKARADIATAYQMPC